jgi:hypothetical protein
MPLIPVLAAVLAAGAQAPRCRPVPCTVECWSVSIKYTTNTAAPGQAPALLTASAEDPQPFGSMDSARCRAQVIAREGFWLPQGELVPGGGPELVPPAAVNVVRILERPF